MYAANFCHSEGGEEKNEARNSPTFATLQSRLYAGVQVGPRNLRTMDTIILMELPSCFLFSHSFSSKRSTARPGFPLSVATCFKRCALILPRSIPDCSRSISVRSSVRVGDEDEKIEEIFPTIPVPAFSYFFRRFTPVAQTPRRTMRRGSFPPRRGPTSFHSAYLNILACMHNKSAS